jgi:preprotein translocase subunit SecG
MSTFVTIVHVITCVLLVLVIMIQSGKGAEISATLGGSSQTIFGSSGGANFFVRFTQAMAAIFMVTSLSLTLMKGRERRSVFETAPLSTSAPAPNVPGMPVNEGAPPVAQPAAPGAPAAGGGDGTRGAPTQPMNTGLKPGANAKATTGGAGSGGVATDKANDAPARPKTGAAPDAKRPE